MGTKASPVRSFSHLPIMQVKLQPSEAAQLVEILGMKRASTHDKRKVAGNLENLLTTLADGLKKNRIRSASAIKASLHEVEAAADELADALSFENLDISVWNILNKQSGIDIQNLRNQIMNLAADANVSARAIRPSTGGAERKRLKPYRDDALLQLERFFSKHAADKVASNTKSVSSFKKGCMRIVETASRNTGIFCPIQKK